MMNWLKTGMIVIVQILFFVSVFAMSTFSEDLIIELEVGYEALDEYKSYQLSDDYDYVILDEEVITIDANNLVIAKHFGNTWIDVYENNEKINSYEVIVYLVGDEPVPWGSVSVKTPFLSGYPDQTMKAEKPITYGELVTMLSRMMNLETEVFPVVSHWSDPYRQAIDDIMLLPYLKNKIPESNITKAEMAYVITRYADYFGFSLPSDVGNINDVTFQDPFFQLIHSVVKADLMTLEDGNFQPDQEMKRYEVICILNVLNDRNQVLTSDIIFKDLDEKDSYYLEILKALAPN